MSLEVILPSFDDIQENLILGSSHKDENSVATEMPTGSRPAHRSRYIEPSSEVSRLFLLNPKKGHTVTIMGFCAVRLSIRPVAALH